MEDFSIIQLNPNAKTKIIPNEQEGKEIRKIWIFNFVGKKHHFISWRGPNNGRQRWTLEVRWESWDSVHMRGWPEYPQSTAATWNNPLKDSECGSFCLNQKCFSREPQNNRSLPSNYNGQTHRPRVHFQDKTFQWLPRGYPYSSSHITGKVPIGMGADSC